jgi:outer membrane receptor for ferrienterochelin and colicins
LIRAPALRRRPLAVAACLFALASPPAAFAQHDDHEASEHQAGEHQTDEHGHDEAVELDAVIVESTRSRRRTSEEPIRVEVIEREEIEEKLLMTPGNIAMLVAETGGVRVQVTSPAGRPHRRDREDRLARYRLRSGSDRNERHPVRVRHRRRRAA